MFCELNSYVSLFLYPPSERSETADILFSLMSVCVSVRPSVRLCALSI